MIYDCVLEPERWVETLHAIRSDLSFLQALLGVWLAPCTVPVACPRWFSAGIDEMWVERLPQYGHDMNEYWGGAEVVQNIPLEELQVASQARGGKEVPQNQFVKEFLAPLAIIDLVSCVVMRNGAAWAGITFTRHEDAGPVRETEVEALRLLGPHFRRAVEIGNLLDMKTIEAAGLASALEALYAGLVLVDLEARVIHANAAARAMLDAADPIRLVRGRLCLPTPLASDALADAIARSAGSLGQLGQGGISIPARMKDGRPCVAHVLPMRGGEAPWGSGDAPSPLLLLRGLKPGRKCLPPLWTWPMTSRLPKRACLN